MYTAIYDTAETIETPNSTIRSGLVYLYYEIRVMVVAVE